MAIDDENMPSHQTAGLPGLLRHYLKDKTREELIDYIVSTMSELGKHTISQLNAIKKRNQAGGYGKTHAYAPVRALCADVCDAIRNRSGKKPPLKIFAQEITDNFEQYLGKGRLQNLDTEATERLKEWIATQRNNGSHSAIDNQWRKLK